MKVVHRISLRATARQRRELEFLGVQIPAGISLPGGGDAFAAFDVAEDHPNWATLQELLRRWGASDFVSTKFSKKEIAAARWLELISDWHHGYPQPNELDFGYREATYDLTNYCPACGIGMKQKAPFQMEGEPRWGRFGILQLNWVFDEFFVTPEVWESVFHPFGVGCRPVTDAAGAELRTVVQLDVQEVVGIATDNLAEQSCSVCQRMKYLPAVRGPFPALKDEPLATMARTKEFFGSGASAYKCILLSQALAQAIAVGGVRGASVRPTA